MRSAVWVGVLILWPAVAARAEKPEPAELTLEVLEDLLPEQVPEAAPPRFTLMEDGRFYCGGLSVVTQGRLEGAELKALRRQIAQVRALKGVAAASALGSGRTRYHLSFRKGPAIDAVGDPDQAPYPLRPLAALLKKLATFDHPSLRAFYPTVYRLRVRVGRLAGGCREWRFPVALVDALPSPQTVAAAAATGWPTGVWPASVCSNDKNYIVTLRPLLPNEVP